MNNDIENASKQISEALTKKFGTRIQGYMIDHDRLKFVLLPGPEQDCAVWVEVLIDEDKYMANRYREIAGRKAAETRRKNKSKPSK